MGAVILTGDLSDSGTVISGEFGAVGELIFWRHNPIFASQKVKTNYFRNSFGTDGSFSPMPAKPFLQDFREWGLDPSWLIFAFLGRPDFQSRGPKMLISKGLLGPQDGKSVRPENAKISHDGSNPPFSAL